MLNPESPDISAQAYLARLAERGIDYVFANAGTDFAPVIESLAMNANGRRKFPKVIIVPHENVAMAMAHGYYKIAGKPAAVMVHVTVGTGNTVNGLMNAARDNIPILLAAGRTPITETGHHASRNRPIHWGQESFDQGGMVREFTKWDYELRSGQPVAAIVDRALDIAMSEPRGPVYLTLPREVLSDAATAPRRDEERPLGAMAAVPSQEAIDAAADLFGRRAVSADPDVCTRPLARSLCGVRGADRRIRAAGGAGRAERSQPAVQSSDESRLRRQGAVAARRRRAGARCAGAVGAEGGIAGPRRQDHPHLARSAADAISVPRFRGRSADHRHDARRAAAVAREPCASG